MAMHRINNRSSPKIYAAQNENGHVFASQSAKIAPPAATAESPQYACVYKGGQFAIWRIHSPIAPENFKCELFLGFVFASQLYGN